MGPHASNSSLCLREFPTSLTGKAYTWFYRLHKDDIYDFNELTRHFYAKFYYAQEELTMFKLAREIQKPGEKPVDFVKRFSARSLDLVRPAPEDELVQHCVQAMDETYRQFLAIHKFKTFQELADAASNLVLKVVVEPHISGLLRGSIEETIQNFKGLIKGQRKCQ